MSDKFNLTYSKKIDYEEISSDIRYTRNEFIFIAIPSCEEEDLYETVTDCFLKAKKPENIFIGIVNQKKDGSFEDFSQFQNVRTIDIKSDYSIGLGAAFALACSLLHGEKYFMRIDAHMRFVENWDEILIKNFLNIKKDGYKKPIISYRTSWFEKDKDGNIKYHKFDHPDLSAMKKELIPFLAKNQEIEHQLKDTLKSLDEDWDDKQYKQHYMICGHFMFAERVFVDEVFPDIRVVFLGEEHTIPIRAFTRGYRIFAIKDEIVFHLGKDKKYLENIGQKNWKNNLNKIDFDKNYLWKKYTGFFKNILKGEEIGYYGAKDEESYLEYIRRFGVSYRDIL